MLAERAPLGTLEPGTLSAKRAVPASIPRPEYVGKPAPTPDTGSEVNDAETISRIRRTAKLAAQALEEIGKAVAPGMTTDDLDRIGHDYSVAHDAYPSSLDYRGFPKSLCTSVNEVICHGIPDSTVLREGDIVNVDLTLFREGVHGDNSATFYVGEVDEESRLLVERTHKAMERGIKAVRPGREVNIIGRVIESYAKRFDYGVVREFTGHGVGKAFHSGLIIPHYDAAPEHAEVMQPGMVFTIEPMITLGTARWTMWEDNWTVLTADRGRTAQFEHMVLVTEEGSEVLTLPDAVTT